MMHKLSILIPSIESRKSLLSSLVCDLIQQCGVIKSISSSVQNHCIILFIQFENVEIIVATDQQQISTGEKRNLLLSVANNTYCSMIDDDDIVYDYYVKEIIEAIQSGVDCIGTMGYITTNNTDEIEWRLSKDYSNITIKENGKNVYLRTTNHISIIKTELARQAGFPPISNAEDKAFSERLQPLLKTEVKINKPLYYYRYQTTNKSYK